ncbi:copper resistance protein CopC [Prauserella marina]|nr:copper resistance CopC family protein [Prauserella marina]ASR33696.1 copper resistance protein CopC [Prauserella marina]
MRRVIVMAGVALLALLGAATPASAHNTLVSSDPAEGAQLEEGPSRVTLTFDQTVQDAGVNQIAVTGPDGGQWIDGDVEVDSNVVSAPLRPLGPAGEYIIGFRILSADGHPVEKEIRFTLTKAGTGTPGSAAATEASPDDTAAPASDSSGGIPVWVWIIAAVVLLGVGVTVALRMGSSGEDKKS